METWLVVLLVALAGAAGSLASLVWARQRASVELETWRKSQATEAERRKEIEDQFTAIASRVVSAQSKEFLINAAATFEERSKAIAHTLEPFKQQLDNLAAQTQALEARREGAYGETKQHIDSLMQATQALQTSSTKLLQALRSGGSARGRWGEIQLQNIAELAGMKKHCDFDTQVGLSDRSRPDMIVRLPGADGRIPVDAKVPMDAYMRALDATDPDVRTSELRAHADALRKHVVELSKRDYAAALGARVDYTVLFVPGEPVLAAAFETDPNLQVDAIERRVLIATPVTLVALLLTVALYWRQQNLAENAHILWNYAREFHKRVTTFFVHFSDLGGALKSATKNYNEAVGSYERMVLPQGRRLEELAPPPTEAGRLPEPVLNLGQVRTLSPSGDEAAASPEFGDSDAPFNNDEAHRQGALVPLVPLVPPKEGSEA